MKTQRLMDEWERKLKREQLILAASLLALLIVAVLVIFAIPELMR